MDVIPKFNLPYNVDVNYYLLGCLLAPFTCFIFSKGKSLIDLSKSIFSFLSGFLVGMSVMVGGLTFVKNNLHLFKYDLLWDPTILVYFGVGMVVHFVLYHLLNKK